MNERALFDAALELEDPVKRRIFVEKACAGNQELLQKVMSLLAAHEQANSFLENPAIKLDPSDVSKTALASDIDKTSDFSIGNSDEAFAKAPTKEIDRDDEDQVDLSFLMPSAKSGSIGSLGHYEILQILGQGGFGIVLKAFDEKLHRLVAIKVMNPQMATTSPPRKRFLREARSVAAIKNENIVQVYSVEEQPLPYMVMEFIDGQTLQDKLDGNGPLDVNEVLYLGRQMAVALAAAHALGIIHRDIKPGNILLEQGAEQKVKITDFGLARTVDDASMTRTGLISGTPMYMAPEQALGLTLDHRTDLFSLGSVLYQMACGRPPFRAPTTVAVLRRVAEDTPRSLQEIVPELPDWMVVIINKLLEKKPEDRFQSAEEVAEVLQKCQSELQLKGIVTGVPLPQSRHLATQDKPSSADESSAKHSSLNQSPQQPEINQPSAIPQDLPRRSETDKLKLSWTLYGILLGVMVLLPILFGKQIGDYMNGWIWPAIPALPATSVAGGLEFDGKDDFVRIEAVDWSYPQFTIEAFVTSAPNSDNGTVVQLGSGGDKPEWMSLYDDHPADSGKRLSGAAIQGKTPFANTSAPLTAGVRQHRALVFDGRHMHYYVNGIWQAKRFAEAHEGLMWKMKNLRIACDGSERRFFQGRIDQVRISRVARYDNNFAPITSLTSDDSTLALYNFDEGAGEILKDASGNGHDGKIVGAKWVNSKSRDVTSNPNSPPSENSNTKSKISNALTGWPADAPPPAIAPFNAAQAKQHQEAWAKYLKVPVEYTNSIGMKFRLIPPGEFLMGAPQDEIDALVATNDPQNKVWEDVIRSQGPQHKVILTQPFYAGIHEVTQGQFQRVMGEQNQTLTQPEGTLETSESRKVNHPVRTATWGDAIKFTVQLSQQEKLPASYLAADGQWIPQNSSGYRLPTEAQWEFFCRAGTTTRYWSGPAKDDLLAVDWVAENSENRTHAVGEKPANPFGLFDVHGNEIEWTENEFDPTGYQKFQETPAIDPRRLENAGWTTFVARGGRSDSWGVLGCSSANRLPRVFGNAPIKSDFGGCRLVLGVEAVRTLSKLTGP